MRIDNLKVKELIKELKNMPQNLEVAVQMGDNSEGEFAGFVCSVWEEEEREYSSRESELSRRANPDKPTGRMFVVLRC